MSAAWPIYISFAGALAMLFTSKPAHSRALALLTTIVGFLAACGGAIQYGIGHDVSVVTKHPWIPALGIEYFLGVDGVSIAMILLTGVAAIAGVLFSWNIEHRIKEFFIFYLVLIGSVYGVFVSFDLFLLFVFYELVVVPKYFLIAIWGSGQREYAAMKLALYSFVGSALILAGLFAAFAVSGGKTFNLLELAKYPFPETFQYWAFPLTFIGFAILAGLWPFHTWAPTGHAAAPTAGSMLLAGVVMKLGAYGAFRVAITLFPLGARAWQTEMALLAVIGIVYGASVALVQRDIKLVIGYSSVSHMGFVVLGLMTLNQLGLSGAVLQMFSHGILGALLFAIAGRMVYARTHTRDLEEIERMRLGRLFPFAAGAFVLAAIASMGIPGFSGFVAELSILGSAWNAFPTFAVVAGIGILIGLAFNLRAVQKVFYGPEIGGIPCPETVPITIPERLGVALLITTSLVIGLAPERLIHLITSSFASPLFDALRKGVAL